MKPQNLTNVLLPIFMLSLNIILLSCMGLNGNTGNDKIMTGKYYANHGLRKEVIVLLNDSLYVHSADSLMSDTASWFRADTRVFLDKYKEFVDYETGSLIISEAVGVRMFRYRRGILAAGIEPLDFVHESLWDTLENARK
jgi:hypothetical protein